MLPRPMPTTFGAPGICAGAEATRFLKQRGRMSREEILEQRRAHMEVIRELIDEYWPLLRRIKDLHSGKAPFEEVCAEIVRCAALRPRDERALASLLRDCIHDRTHKDDCCHDYTVDIEKLYAATVLHEKTRRPPEWQTRFKAEGILDAPIQRRTTGVERNAWNYMRLYRGVPFAQTADAACAEALTSDYHAQLLAQIREALMQHAELVPYADIRHPDHPQHQHLRRAVHQKQTSSSAGRLVSPRRERAVVTKDGVEAFLTPLQCQEALLGLRRGFLGHREVTEMLRALDPRLTGYVRVDDVMRRFAFELLKPKASRNTLGLQNNDGVTTAFEWPNAEPPPTGVPSGAHHIKRCRAASARTTTVHRMQARRGSLSPHSATMKAMTPRGAPPQPTAVRIPKPPPTSRRSADLTARPLHGNNPSPGHITSG